MKIKYGLFLSAAVIMVSLYACTSCSDPASPADPAEKITVEKLKAYPGFSWFETRFDYYSPNQAIIDSIKVYYNSAAHSFYIFAAPACSCDDSQKPLPYGMKVMSESGVTANGYELFLMENKSSSHPYADTISINSLPAIYVIKNGEPVFSVIDSLKRRAWLAENSGKPNETIEALFLEALKK